METSLGMAWSLLDWSGMCSYCCLIWLHCHAWMQRVRCSFRHFLFMLHVTNQLDVYLNSEKVSRVMKAGYNGDGELPCTNPTSKSYHWISSIVILFLFADHKMTFLKQERESSFPVTLQNRNDWLRWEWTKLVKAHDPTTPLWAIALCRITTGWSFEKFPVCVRFVDLT